MSRKLKEESKERIASNVKSQFPIDELDLEDIVTAIVWEYEKQKQNSEVFR